MGDYTFLNNRKTQYRPGFAGIKRRIICREPLA